jgi:hypothetical protein
MKKPFMVSSGQLVQHEKCGCPSPEKHRPAEKIIALAVRLTAIVVMTSCPDVMENRLSLSWKYRMNKRENRSLRLAGAIAYASPHK